MKRAAIREAVDGHLQALGFGKGTWEWVDATAELVFILGKHNTETFRLKILAGFTQKQVMFECGYISGLVKALGLPPKPNGVHKAAKPKTLKLTAEQLNTARAHKSRGDGKTVRAVAIPPSDQPGW